MTVGWTRVCGRANYVGWKLYLRGPSAAIVVGHTLAGCVFYWLLFRLGFRFDTSLCGRVIEMRILKPREDAS